MHLFALSLLVPDYDVGISFCVNALGFVVHEDIPQGEKRWVTVGPAEGGVRFVLARAVGQIQQAAIGAQGGGRVWLFLETDDFDTDHARLSAHGAVFEEEPRDEPYGRVAVFRAPFGNRWDLIKRAN